MPTNSQKTSMFRFVTVWIGGNMLIIPLVWVLIGPDVIMIAGTFLGGVFGARVSKQWEERQPEWRQLQTQMATIAVTIGAAIATAAGLFAILQLACTWLKRAETVEMQFLNRELIYGFTLCYPPGTVDYFSLTAIVVFEYFVLGIIVGVLLAIGKIFGLVGRAVGAVMRST